MEECCKANAPHNEEVALMLSTETQKVLVEDVAVSYRMITSAF